MLGKSDVGLLGFTFGAWRMGGRSCGFRPWSLDLVGDWNLPRYFSSSDIIQHLHVGQWAPSSDWDPLWPLSSQASGTRVNVAVSSYTLLFCFVFVLFKYHSENNELLKAS